MENTSITSLPQKLISFSLCSAFLPIETKQGGFCFFVFFCFSRDRFKLLLISINAFPLRSLCCRVTPATNPGPFLNQQERRMLLGKDGNCNFVLRTEMFDKYIDKMPVFVCSCVRV